MHSAIEQKKGLNMTEEQQNSQSAKTKSPAWLKPLCELGPLLLFIVLLLRKDVMTATMAFGITAPIGAVVLWIVTKKLPMMPLISAAMVAVAAGLTLFFDNEMFIKMKPTLFYCLFGFVLLGGLLLKKNLFKMMMGQAVQLEEKGWSLMTRNWIIFFFFLAAMNEVAWRSFSTETWALSKLVFLAATFVFAIAQMPLILRYTIKDAQDD